jgi:mannose-6-phosphate isomerase-like protein (cupin superfamily)
MGPAPWSRRIIADERNLVTLIASGPGGGNRPHWHREFDEWWVVLAGHLQWELSGGIVVEGLKDDIVWVPRGTVHHIRNVGTDLSLRLAVAMPPAMHYFSACEQCGFTDDGPREWCA